MNNDDKVDVAALKVALRTLAVNRKLIERSVLDLGTTPTVGVEDVLLVVREALRHIIEDDFRNDGMRGGS